MGVITALDRPLRTDGHWAVEDLEGYWGMREGSGGIAHDETTNENHGVLTNMVPEDDWVLGEDGDWALDLDGSDDYIQVPDDAAFDIVNNLTVCVLFRTDTIAGTDFAITKYLTTGNNREWALRLQSQKIQVNFGDPADGTFEGQITTDDNVIISTSEFFAVSLVFASGTPTIYVNGQAVAHSVTLGAIPNTLYNGTADLLIGNDGGLVAANAFDGLIDSASIYSRAPTPLQIEELANYPDIVYAPRVNLWELLSAAGVIHEGAVAFAGEGDIDLVATAIRKGAVAFAGEGSLDLVGTAIRAGAVAFAAEGAIALVATVARSGAVEFAGEGSLDLVATAIRKGAVAFAGEGSITFVSTEEGVPLIIRVLDENEILRVKDVLQIIRVNDDNTITRIRL